MAYERLSQSDTHSSRANTDLTGALFRALKRVGGASGANPPNVELAGALEPNFDGVCQGKFAQGEAVRSAHSGITKMIAGAAITLPAKINTDAQGRAVKVTAGAYIGTAEMGASAAGDVISVNLDLAGTIPA